MTWIFVTKTLKYKEAKEFGVELKWAVEASNTKWVYVY